MKAALAEEKKQLEKRLQSINEALAPEQSLWAPFNLSFDLDTRLSYLMDRNNEGALSVQEITEFKSLVQYAEGLSLLKARFLLEQQSFRKQERG